MELFNTIKTLLRWDTSKDMTNLEKAHRELILALQLAITFGIVSILLFTYGIDYSKSIVLSISIIISAAALISGYFLGFLFGIPKYKANPSGADDSDYTPSNSLTEVADWLTKIIVGLGLVEMRKIPELIESIGIFVGNYVNGSCHYSCSSSLVVFSNGLVIYNGVFGIYYGYNYARIVLSSHYKEADENLKKAKELKEAIDSKYDANIPRFQTIVQQQRAALALSNVPMEIMSIDDFNSMLDDAKRRMNAGMQLFAKFKDSDKDPQKDQWGGKNENNNRKMTATVCPLGNTKSLYKVDVKIESTDPKDPMVETSPVLFALHNTYRNPFKLVAVKGGIATIELVVYGAFTVGAFVDNGRTPLELDLATIPGAPKEFISN